MRLRALSSLLALLAALAFTARAQDDPRRDSQIWPDSQINIGLRQNLTLLLSGTARLGRDDFSAFVNEQAGIGLSLRLSRNFTTSFQYRYIHNEPTPDRQSREHRLHVDLTARTPLKWGLALSDRVRAERRDVNHALSWRYRNRLQIERPVTIHERRFIPYLSAEPYYDTRFHTWSRVQYFIGSRIPLSKHVTLDGFYMRQIDARVRPGFLHVLGVFWRVEI